MCFSIYNWCVRIETIYFLYENQCLKALVYKNLSSLVFLLYKFKHFFVLKNCYKTLLKIC